MGNIDFGILTDTQLLSWIKGGNQLAFYHLYNKYWRELYSRTLNVLKDKGKTEDVLHEVFTSIWIRRHTLEIANVKGYLLTAVRNNAFEKIHSEKYIDLGEDIIAGMTVPARIDQFFDYEDLKETIEKAVKELPVRRRTIFYMSRYQEYSIAEIAIHFGISHRTVENQLHLALKHLRNAMGITLYFFISLGNPWLWVIPLYA
ncbi:MAG: RNA polymerase sigma-70 factor [Bacteroidota bacterium]